MAPQEPMYTPLDGGSYADRPKTSARMYISNSMKDILIVLLALSTAISSISAFNRRYVPTQENFGYRKSFNMNIHIITDIFELLLI